LNVDPEKRGIEVVLPLCVSAKSKEKVDKSGNMTGETREAGFRFRHFFEIGAL
jgi:hypothetical protein